MRLFTLFLFVSVLGAAPASAAAAPFICGPRESIEARLAETYSERPMAMGLSTEGWVVEVFTTRHGGTWTIIATSPNGVSCISTFGQNWERLLWPEEEEGS